MHNVSLFTTLFSLTAGFGLTFSPVALSGQLPDGTIFFDRAPRLLGATTPYNQTRIRNVPYYFTVELPESAGKPLGKVRIDRRRGASEIQFNLSETIAFMGTPSARGERLNLGAVETDEETGGVSISFEPPLEPGTLVTVGLMAASNPKQSGVYLFGVTAFPAGETVLNLYLGPGRLQFYRDESLFDEESGD